MYFLTMNKKLLSAHTTFTEGRRNPCKILKTRRITTIRNVRARRTIVTTITSSTTRRTTQKTTTAITTKKNINLLFTKKRQKRKSHLTFFIIIFSADQALKLSGTHL